MCTNLYLATRIVANYTDSPLPVMQMAAHTPGASEAINRVIARYLDLADSTAYPYDKVPVNEILDANRAEPTEVA